MKPFQIQGGTPSSLPFILLYSHKRRSSTFLQFPPLFHITVLFAKLGSLYLQELSGRADVLWSHCLCPPLKLLCVHVLEISSYLPEEIPRASVMPNMPANYHCLEPTIAKRSQDYLYLWEHALSPEVKHKRACLVCALPQLSLIGRVTIWYPLMPYHHVLLESLSLTTYALHYILLRCLSDCAL